MSTLTTSSPSIEHRRRWKWFLALGAVLLVLGLAGAGAAPFLEATAALVFGPLLLVSSLMQLLTAMFTEERNQKRLHFVAAGAELALALAVMAWPPQSAIGVVGVVAFCLVVIGVARLAHSLVMRARERSWVIVTGAVALLLGIVLGACHWLGLPVRGVLLIAVCLALDFLCHGVSWTAMALIERKPLPEHGS
jgi:uncharacterized membrane protein HdeD (DUF308 family)